MLSLARNITELGKYKLLIFLPRKSVVKN